MKTSHWHGNVKITATSGGGWLGTLVLLVLLLVGGAMVGRAVTPAVPVAIAIGDAVLTIAGSLAALFVASVGGLFVYELVGERRADRIEAHWRASLPAPPPPPLRVEAQRIDQLPAAVPHVDTELAWEREPVDLDALRGER